jgi:hypothetical protein
MLQGDPRQVPASRLDPFPPHQAVDPNQSPIARSPFAQRRGGIAAVFVLGIIVLLGAMALRDAGPLFTEGNAETAAVHQLCADEVNQNYAAVYELITIRYSQGVLEENQAAFVAALRQRDLQYGPVTSCTIASRDIPGTLFAFGGAVYEVSVTLGDGTTHTGLVTFGNVTTHTGPVTLVNSGGWKFDQFDLALHLDG